MTIAKRTVAQKHALYTALLHSRRISAVPGVENEPRSALITSLAAAGSPSRAGGRGSAVSRQGRPSLSRAPIYMLSGLTSTSLGVMAAYG